MPTVSVIQSQFLNSLSDSRYLFSYCRSPYGPYTNAGVEMAFLEAFKAWEVFIEELTIAYLIGEPDIAGNQAPTLISISGNNPETCRKIIVGERRTYAEWANPDDLRRRLELYFAPSTLDSKLAPVVPDLREMVSCRNAIAHSSGSARVNLNNLWTRRTGTSKSPLRTADVLLLSYTPNPPMTWFDRYLDVLEVLSQNLAQV